MDVTCFIMTTAMMLVGGLLGFMGKRLSESRLGRNARKKDSQ